MRFMQCKGAVPLCTRFVNIVLGAVVVIGKFLEEYRAHSVNAEWCTVTLKHPFCKYTIYLLSLASRKRKWAADVEMNTMAAKAVEQCSCGWYDVKSAIDGCHGCWLVHTARHRIGRQTGWMDFLNRAAAHAT